MKNKALSSSEKLAICKKCEHYWKATTQCGICKCFNGIYDRWDNWEPENQIMTILKTRISEIENI